MIKLDLITGFLGSGKTTFIKEYAKYLIDRGNKLCIIENDFGAINIDLVLLKELESKKCNLEMVVGGDGPKAHKRRLKTKLIAMAMQGFDRVIIEPSGIYDVDEFFDLLYEEPLDRFYEVGNVIAIINPKLEKNLSRESRYLFMSEAAKAGGIILSRAGECTDEEKKEIISRLREAMTEFGCRNDISDNYIYEFDDKEQTSSLFDEIVKCGYNQNNYEKLPVSEENVYKTCFYFDFEMEIEKLEKIAGEIFEDKSCGAIHRIKGIVKSSNGAMSEINITRNEIMTKEVNAERAVLIVIGEDIDKENLAKYLGEATL